MLLSGAEIGRFVAMLRNPSSILKSCAAFALLQVDLSIAIHFLKLVFSSPLLFLIYDGCNVLVVVLHPWWSTCCAPCDPFAERGSSTGSTWCSCSSNCPNWSQNLCKNRPSQPRAPPDGTVDLKPLSTAHNHQWRPVSFSGLLASLLVSSPVACLCEELKPCGSSSCYATEFYFLFFFFSPFNREPKVV